MQSLPLLKQEGNVCEQDQPGLAGAVADTAAAESSKAVGSITDKKQLKMGRFDINIVSNDIPDDMAIWLQDNNYLLTDRGRNLLEPYILNGMKFVAL